MAKTIRSIFVWTAAAIICIVALSFYSSAASAVDPSLIGYVGIGPGGSSAASVQTSATLPEATAPNYTTETVDGVTYYIFEGHRYTLGPSWGTHKVSGYSPMETGTSMTSSGFDAAEHHTVAASSELPLGTVIILSGVSGPCCDEFDGMYVVEDRGGYYIETEQWIDIFFDTYAEAVHATDAGWNYCEAWIAVPVDE